VVREEWLKDRRGRTLSKDDIVHYQKVVVALAETIPLMQEIDEVIEAHAGWPGAFQAAGSAGGVIIQVITALSLRLDLAADWRSLADTVDTLKPRLLILDSFVRLHHIDENASGQVGPLLAYLRELQRRYGLAVLVVHHAKKGGGHTRAGQALRGSSEFHAWGDSNLYLRREGEMLTLTVEHRAAASPKPMKLELVQSGEALALHIVDRSEAVPRSLDERITAALADAHRTLPFAELRSHCRVGAATLYQRLAALTSAGCVIKACDGYRLAG
jgi:hypothetical protein